MQNLFSLLTLPTPFQAAVKEGKIGLSQGYLFAANLDLDNRKLYEIFQAILEKPVTYDELKNSGQGAKGEETRITMEGEKIFLPKRWISQSIN